MARKKLSFEEAMKRLEEIVSHLEKGDIPLEESIRLFEEGSGLLALCSSGRSNHQYGQQENYNLFHVIRILAQR